MSLKLYQHSVNHPRALSWEQCTTFLGAMYYFLGSNILLSWEQCTTFWEQCTTFWEQCTTFLGAIAKREKESVARLTRDFKATQLQFTDSRLPGW